MIKRFELKAPFEPTGDQPQAIASITSGIDNNLKHQILLGVTGSGKTFSIAHVIANTQMPALVMAPNKTLAAQLYQEFKEFFPENAVEYFVSYYDYYQPEAYIPERDFYIEKDSRINEEIDKLRHSATSALLSRGDAIIVASVSCIYNLGSPQEYLRQSLILNAGSENDRQAIIGRLVEMQYERNDYDFSRGKFRVRGDIIEIYPAYDNQAIKVELFGDIVERILVFDSLTAEVSGELSHIAIFPATHFLTSQEGLEPALESIQVELEERLAFLESNNKLVEAQRLRARTMHDIEMMREVGYCPGIENYSRHLSGKKPQEAPDTLIDYFPKEFLIFIDESHITIPQIRGMYEGDRARKETLIEYGFRLPSALDNRPLRFDEFLDHVHQGIYISATPGPWEMEVSQNTAEKIIRPTGLVDPEVIVRETKGQIDDLIKEARQVVKDGGRVLVTTLTKKMAEDLTDYMLEHGINARYLHSDIDTIERVEILRDLRLGKFDVLVGINLLREGLDLPEVMLVAILDADKEGFLRSERSLIQTIGRTARNVSGRVIMYADKETNSMRRAIRETNRRRETQLAYNAKHGIEPRSIQKAVSDLIQAAVVSEKSGKYQLMDQFSQDMRKMPKREAIRLIKALEEEMGAAAVELNFELAAEIRDQIYEIRKEFIEDS